MKIMLNNSNEITLEDFIQDNLQSWVSMRIGGVSASMADSPYVAILMTKAFDAAVDNIRPIDLIASNRISSIALMLANAHLEDGDCLGDAARELYGALNGKFDLPKDFDC